MEFHSKWKAEISEADIVMLWLSSQKDLSTLQKIRERMPKCWLVVIAGKRQLQTVSFQNLLLQSPEKDEVWISETWELGFWFSLQRILKTHTLRSGFQELSKASGKLISQLEKDVGLASNIQRSLLPKFSPDIPGVSVAVKYLPASGAGGDYYDIFEFGDKRRFGVLLADSKTHGMAAALLAVLLKVRLEEMKDRFPDSKSFIEFLNREFQSLPRQEVAPLSLLYGILDRASFHFHYTVAGPLVPLLWRDGQAVDLAIPPSPQLGTLENFTFREQEIRLQPGDLLLLHTDGLDTTLGKNPHDQLSKILKKRSDPLEIQNELMALIDHAKDKHPLHDDVTVIHFAIHARALYVAQSR